MTKREIASSKLRDKGYRLKTTTAKESAEHNGARWCAYELIRDGSGCVIQIGAEHYFRTLADVEKFAKELQTKELQK
jgi:hypothetical protein